MRHVGNASVHRLAFSQLNGARSIPDMGFIAGRQCPRQIVQIDGQKFLVLFQRILCRRTQTPPAQAFCAVEIASSNRPASA
jgi:hypothetical protein